MTPKKSISSETYFFRDHGQFDLLRFNLLPELIERRQNLKSLRLWSAGCASGEEAYSLAILIDMLLPARDDWNIFLFASDIDPSSLAKAKQARYRSWSFRQFPPDLQKRYFRQDGPEWILHDNIRTMVRFGQVDLVRDAFPNGELKELDLILCRNVFIYFETSMVQSAAQKLTESLRVGGYFMTAHAELSGLHFKKLRTRVFPESIVYQRLERPTQPMPEIGIISEAAIGALPTEPRRKSTTSQAEPANVMKLLRSAHALADRGVYDDAERLCHLALAQAPLAAEPYFLLAQLAQLKGNFEQATAWLEKNLYLSPCNLAATLELAALYERSQNLNRAQALKRSALDIARSLPPDMPIEPYQIRAGVVAQWLSL